MATDEILEVNKYSRESGDWLVECPHCKRIIGLEDGPIKGEMYQHKGDCNGWLEVARTAKFTKSLV